MNHSGIACSCGQEGTQCFLHTLKRFADAMHDDSEYADEICGALEKMGATRADALARVNAVRTACHRCGRPSDKQCTRCKVRRYCSIECQRADWPAHKPHCK